MLWVQTESCSQPCIQTTHSGILSVHIRSIHITWCYQMWEWGSFLFLYNIILWVPYCCFNLFHIARQCIRKDVFLYWDVVFSYADDTFVAAICQQQRWSYATHSFWHNSLHMVERQHPLMTVIYTVLGIYPRKRCLFDSIKQYPLKPDDQCYIAIFIQGTAIDQEPVGCHQSC